MTEQPRSQGLVRNKAKRLRKEARAAGVTLDVGRSLRLAAQHYGFKSWREAVTSLPEKENGRAHHDHH